MKADQFSIIPLEVAFDRRLTQRQMRVLIALFSFRSKTTNTVWPSRELIAQRTRLDLSTISTATTDLVRMGWLLKEGTGGHSKATRYTLCVPDLDVETVAESATVNGASSIAESATVSAPKKVAESATVAESTTVAESATRPVAESARGCVSRKARGAKNIPMNKPLEQSIPGGASLPAAPASVSAPEKALLKAVPVDAKETALQAACRATWAAYSAAYERRYGAKPVRNATVNAKVKQFVQRLGHDESPAVAEFYADRVSERLVVQRMHDFGLLLSGAEGYRTQWAAGATMTSTRAQQIDQSQSNHDAAEAAMAILREQRRMAGERA